ncbi:LPS assembly protein LptD [Sedimentitalea sp. JM2-8]|uniref:LPS-assembly protein LptD n=1 Tax=Sedimentitalea xiamensis TaxID=3050037 RepID=A0ABT7FD64_9RHOB|nr:LPS assembly protein LptD [Sedimentitalea xiamensis]MDK3073059.1 LPS assembly protein LptD [Sedimentitalea xiamensis]
MMRRLLASFRTMVLVLSCLAGPVLAQDGSETDAVVPALLVADSVVITPERQLIAEGNVEAFQGDVRLSARRITFDRATDTMTIEGPIRIDEGGTVTILADFAEMDGELQNGLLTGARMVLDQQLQMASLQMTRVGGRYTQLYKTAVTACHVCEDGSPPLWQIRARKVIHDQQERQLYFEDAQFRVLDVPILYLPRFRLPDPTLERARGFLIPSLRTTTQLGTGLRLPYFIPIGESKDLTLAPYVSPKTRTLDFRYRQAFRNGRLGIEGAYTRDDLIPGESRGYLFGVGRFDLPQDFRLRFDIETVSDNAYVNDYGLPDVDRLRSEIALDRVRRDSAFQFDLIKFKSLRDEDETTQPLLIGDAFYERRFFPAAIGGEARLNFDLHGHERESDLDQLGRDILRASASLSWQRTWISTRGVRADWRLGFAADLFKIYQDSAFPDDIKRFTPSTAVTLSYPMTKTNAGGVTHYLEPLLHLAWSDVQGDDPPNDESRFVEFDQGNLLSLSRFPAPDRREDGPALAYGLKWSRHAPSGWQAWATVGQVFRKTADPNFTATSGLSGTSSDILVAGQYKTDYGLALTGRGLIDGSLSLSKAEFRGDWRSERINVTGSYLWLGTDLAEGREKPLSELWFDGDYQINPSWAAGADLRYDISDARATRAGVGLIYRNECVTVDLSIRRRYTSSTSIEPSTDFGFTIELNGFAVEGGTEKYRRACS